MEKFITINDISVQDKTVTANLTIDGHQEKLTTTVNEACLPYLCTDRRCIRHGTHALCTKKRI